MKYRILKKGEVILPAVDQIKGGLYKKWTSLSGLMGEGNTVDHMWHKFRRTLNPVTKKFTCDTNNKSCVAWRAGSPAECCNGNTGCMHRKPT